MDNPKINSKPGDILWGENNKNIMDIRSHYIIFLGPGRSDDAFEGAMLTHAKTYRNIQMHDHHFEKTDSKGIDFEFQFDDTLISRERYHKKLDWRPFRFAGRLTMEGLTFVQENISPRPKNFKYNQ
jgi:hypothetical protein